MGAIGRWQRVQEGGLRSEKQKSETPSCAHQQHTRAAARGSINLYLPPRQYFPHIIPAFQDQNLKLFGLLQPQEKEKF